jgi:hypothetical protein
VTDPAKELLRMLKASPSKFRHHPDWKTKLWMTLLLAVFIAFGVLLRLFL